MALAHHTLIAWQRADDLFVKLHRLSFSAFPPSERYELGAQLRRAAFSVAANIVEGFATAYDRKQLNFLDTSKSSLAEVGYCIHAARRLGYFTDGTTEDLEREIRRVGAPLVGLIRSCREQSRTSVRASWPGGGAPRLDSLVDELDPHDPSDPRDPP